MPRRREVPVLVSSALAPVLDRPARPARLLGSTSVAVWLDVLDEGGGPGRVVALLGRHATRLPIGVVLPDGAAPLLPAGSLVHVGAGAVRVERCGPDREVLDLRPARWFDPAVRRLRDPRRPPGGQPAHGSPYDALDVVRRWALEGHLPEDVVRTAAAVQRSLAGTATDRERGTTPPALTAAVADALGRGPGLTPAGDDVLAGLLVALVAAGPGAPLTLAVVRAVEAALDPDGRPSAATTALSRELLLCACRGWAVPELDRLMRSVGAPARAGEPSAAPVLAALGALGRVGHTSGRALALGVVVGLTATWAGADRSGQEAA